MVAEEMQMPNPSLALLIPHSALGADFRLRGVLFFPASLQAEHSVLFRNVALSVLNRECTPSGARGISVDYYAR